MKVTVAIKPDTEGLLSKHGVSVNASVEYGSEKIDLLVSAHASRFGADGKERPMNVCLEEAFAEVLKQALA